MKTYLIIILMLCLGSLSAQQPSNANDYIDSYKKIALQQMVATDVPASISLAQGILESAVGTSVLATQGNNHHSIRCTDDWEGKVIYRYRGGEQLCYKVFHSAAESFLQHTMALRGNSKYENLFYVDVKNYKRWAKGLEELGYSDTENYAEQLIQLIELYKLNEIDEQIDLYKENNTTETPADEPIYRPNEEIYYNNGVKSIVATDSETPLELAARMKVPLRQVLKYNDIQLSDRFRAGQFVYLDKKKSTFSGEKNTHTVRAGEDLYDISQLYGIKLKSLQRLNRLKEGEEPMPNEIIYLKKKAPEKPILRSANYRPPMPQDTAKLEVPSPVRIVSPPVSVPPTITAPPTIAPQDTPNAAVTPPQTPAANTDGDGIVDVDRVYVYPDEVIYEGAPKIETVNSRPPSPRPSTRVIPLPNSGGAPSRSASDTENGSISAPVSTPSVSIPKNVHVVVKGETLYSIARKYKISVAQLKKMNGLEVDTIEIDQQLKIRE